MHARNSSPRRPVFPAASHPPSRTTQVLDVVQADLDAVAGCCEAMNAAVQRSKSSTGDLLQQTQVLASSMRMSEQRSQLVGKFLDQYQLTPAEAEALKVTDRPPPPSPSSARPTTRTQWHPSAFAVYAIVDIDPQRKVMKTH
jgi:hypothetical protein